MSEPYITLLLCCGGWLVSIAVAFWAGRRLSFNLRGVVTRREIDL
jgi:hypothetical protein